MALRKDVHSIVSLITSGGDVTRALRQLRAVLEKKQREMNIAKVSFATTGLIGTGMAIGGAIAAPFTFGASLGLTIAGVVVGVTSGAGGLATAIADHIVNSKAMKEAEAAISRYDNKVMDVVNMVHFWYASCEADEFNRIVDDEIRLIPDEKERKKIEIFLRGLRTGIDAGGQALHLGTTIGVNAAVGASRSTLGALGTGLQIVRIGGIVLSVLTIPLDLHTLVSTSLKLHRNTPSTVAEQLEELAKSLERRNIVRADNIYF